MNARTLWYQSSIWRLFVLLVSFAAVFLVLHRMAMQAFLQKFEQLAQQQQNNDSQIAARAIITSILDYNNGSVAILVAELTFIAMMLLLVFFVQLRTITRVVEQFHNGNLSVRLPTASCDEWGTLCIAFNTMAGQVEQSISQLRESDRLRRELITSVSHDLRTPLTSIRGYLETLSMNYNQLHNSERKEFLDIALSNVSSLERLVGDLFELTKLEAKQRPLRLELFRIDELASDLVQKFQPKAGSCSVTLELVIAPNVPWVKADLSLIERAMANLIDNGLNYTSKGGWVRVQVAKKENNVHVAIEDSGTGQLDAAMLEQCPVVNSGCKNEGRVSSGLGLGIVRQIMVAHDSELIMSRTELCGTRCEFDLAGYQCESFSDDCPG